MTPARNRMLSGRSGEFKRIAAALKTGRAVALCGPDGIGKTQLAIEFVHRCGRYFAGGVFWLSFSVPGEVPLQVAACGGTGAIDVPVDFAELALDDQLHLILRAWQEGTPRLLVFDDCDDQEVLREWVPTTGGARVLITSRQATWDPALRITPLPLGPISHDESVELLRRLRPDLQESTRALGQITDELEHMPLAVRLAGGILRRYRGQMSLDSLLDQLRSREVADRAMAMTFEADPARAVPAGQRGLFGRRRSQQASPVARTFVVMDHWLERADSAGRPALALLSRAACFAAGEPIPDEVLLSTVDHPKPEASLAVLIDLGLLEPYGEGLVRLHRPLADLVRSAGADAGSRVAAEEAVIAWAASANDEGEPALRLLALPHLDFVTVSALGGPEDERAAAASFEFGRSLWAAGDLRRARAFVERSLEIRERILGPADHRTISTMSALGSLLQAQGDLAGAQPYLERALELAQSTLGPEHPDVAVILTTLSWVVRYQGDLPGARSLLERALEVSEQTLGPDHPDTISRLDGLGLLLHEQGDLAGARVYSERALEALEETLGALHPSTLQAVNRVGLLLREQGDLEAARTYLEHALHLSEETLGAEHPDTAGALDSMGVLLQAEGDLEGARGFIERALAIRERTLGAENPATGASYNNLGMLMRELGDREAAQPYLEQALVVSQRVLGPYDPQTATSYNNLGALLLELGDLYGAQPHLERALAIREQGLGADHPETAASLANVGALHIAYGDLSGARTYLERALEIREETLSADHPLLADSLYQLGRLLRDLGDLEGARRRLEQAVSIREGGLGPDHPDTLAAMNELDQLVGALGGRQRTWPGTPLPEAEYFETDDL